MVELLEDSAASTGGRLTVVLSISQRTAALVTCPCTSGEALAGPLAAVSRKSVSGAVMVSGACFRGRLTGTENRKAAHSQYHPSTWGAGDKACPHPVAWLARPRWIGQTGALRCLPSRAAQRSAVPERLGSSLLTGQQQRQLCTPQLCRRRWPQQAGSVGTQRPGPSKPPQSPSALEELEEC